MRLIAQTMNKDEYGERTGTFESVDAEIFQLITDASDWPKKVTVLSEDPNIGAVLGVALDGDDPSFVVTSLHATVRWWGSLIKTVSNDGQIRAVWEISELFFDAPSEKEAS